jgi:hypothetical protein
MDSFDVSLTSPDHHGNLNSRSRQAEGTLTVSAEPCITKGSDYADLRSM